MDIKPIGAAQAKQAEDVSGAKHPDWGFFHWAHPTSSRASPATPSPSPVRQCPPAASSSRPSISPTSSGRCSRHTGSSPSLTGSRLHCPPFHFPWISPKVGGGSDDGTAEKCWAPLTEVNNCVNEVYTSFVTRKNSFRLSCCSAVKKLSSHKVCRIVFMGYRCRWSNHVPDIEQGRIDDELFRLLRTHRSMHRRTKSQLVKVAGGNRLAAPVLSGRHPSIRLCHGEVGMVDQAAPTGGDIEA
ncbi:hypothetical protein RJ639_037786 [Escallonia herrerae]|uniref:Prolamin-like domain-containing protein n=1 Tax=Escallonia herrerae TaxID=1293975 RepID=A0AA88WLB4_9ASTE|nr:hypothetical protein RJ639_037786 [Escallonia herrerae]